MSTRPIESSQSTPDFDSKPAEKDLGFYFAGSNDMLRKLEASKPVRRTRTDKNKVGGVNAGQETSTPQEPNYLFKWQREGPNEDDDDDEDEVVGDKSSKAARWAVVSGNVPPSQVCCFSEERPFKPGSHGEGAKLTHLDVSSSPRTTCTTALDCCIL